MGHVSKPWLPEGKGCVGPELELGIVVGRRFLQRAIPNNQSINKIHPYTDFFLLIMVDSQVIPLSQEEENKDRRLELNICIIFNYYNHVASIENPISTRETSQAFHLKVKKRIILISLRRRLSLLCRNQHVKDHGPPIIKWYSSTNKKIIGTLQIK